MGRNRRDGDVRYPRRRGDLRTKSVQSLKRASDDHEVLSTYALYAEILNNENNEIDNAVYTLQKMLATSAN